MARMEKQSRVLSAGLVGMVTVLIALVTGSLIVQHVLAQEGHGDPQARKEQRPGTLTLTDAQTQASKMDSTNAANDTPTLYCSGPSLAGAAGKATVMIALNAPEGTYNWQIQQASVSKYADVLTANNNYQAVQSGISPGAYSLIVTSQNDGTFLRVINFAVIENGQYLPGSYPQNEIAVTEASVNNPFYYESDGGQLRSIMVSAPLDGEYVEEGATNPYAYGNNYSIMINPDDGTATVLFSLPGIYMLCIVRDCGGQLVESFQTLSNGCQRKNQLDPATWPWVLILKPHWDYYVGPDSTEDVFVYSWNSVTIAKDKWSCWNIGQENGTTSIERLVNANYAALGKQKFNLCIDMHGSPGAVSSVTGGAINQNNVVVKLGNQIAGKVNRVRFYSCLTGQMPNGGQFLTNLKLASGATETSAYIQETSVSPWPYTWMAGNWGTKTVR